MESSLKAQTGNHNTPADQGTGITSEILFNIQEEVERQLNLSLAYRVTCVTVAKAAELLCIEEDTVRAWINRGKLQASKIGNNWQIRLCSIDEMLQRYATVIPITDKRFKTRK
ncbi:MAG: helix-turn-helix domain-containing protein [Ferruginibacter sp.]